MENWQEELMSSFKITGAGEIERLQNINAELLEACKIALALLQEYRERVIKGEITGKLLEGDYEPTRLLEKAIKTTEGRSEE